jgi:hypothetical protein
LVPLAQQLMQPVADCSYWGQPQRLPLLQACHHPHHRCCPLLLDVLLDVLLLCTQRCS